MFTGIVLALVIVILLARKLLVPSGLVTLEINDDPSKTLEVPMGGKLLQTLADKKIFVPSACGGGGSCGQCKVQVLEGGGEILPTELGHMSRREVRDHWRLACQTPIKQNMKLQINPEIFFLGEIWTDSMPWLNGHEYDSVMNYPLPGCINDFFHNPKLTFRDFIYSLNRCRTMYPEQITKVLFNFLDTHDTPRVAEISNSVEELIQKIGIIMTLPGTPCIYYGTEIAMKGMDTPYNRSTMPWDEIESGDYDAVSSQIAALIQLRNTHKAFRSNHITYLPDKTLPRLIHYRKSDSIEVIANADKVPYQIDCKGKVLFQNGYRNGVLSENGLLIIKL